jgi:hypothetical protein
MRKHLALGLWLLGFAVVAQNDSLIEFKVGRSFKRLNRPFLELYTEQGGASRNWSSQQMYQFFYGDFVDDAMKAKLMDRAQNGLQLASLQNWDIRLCYEGHQKSRLVPFPKQSLYLFSRSATVLNMSSDLTGLILYGNRSSRGIPQDIGDFNYQSWFYSGIGHQYTFLIDTIPLSVGLGLVAVHTHDDHQIGSAQMLTANDGSRIDFNGDYQFGQSGATATYGVTGWGFALNLETAERYKEHEISLGVRDLGLAYLPDWLSIERDSSFSFSGVDAGRLFTLEQESFEQLIDSLGNGLVGGSRPGAWTVLPANAYLDYTYHLKEQSLYFSFQYRYLPKYIPRFALGYGYSWESFRIRSGFAYGGFNAFSWDLGMVWEVNNTWHLRGGLTNLFGLSLPTWSGGTVGDLGIRYIF